MKSILLVCNLHPKKLGTFEAYLVEFGRLCRDRGTRLGLVLSGPPIPAVEERFRAVGLEWWVIPAWNDRNDRHWLFEFLRGYLPVLRRGPWDVACYQFCHEGAVALATVVARAKRVAPRCSVWVQHSGMVMPGRLGRYASRIRMLSYFVDGLIALDPKARAAIVRRGWPEGRSIVIGNGVSLPAGPRENRLRPSLGLSPRATVLVSVGSLIERKGYDLLLAALAPLMRSHSDRYLLVVGDGPLRDELAATARREAIERQVRFLGLRDDVPALLAEADLFVLASRAEGLSLAVVEALGAGLPVVVTDVGGHREVVTPDTGWLVPPLDVEKFRAAVDEVLRDPAAGRRRGAAGQELVARTFSLTAQVESQYNYFFHVYRTAEARAGGSTTRALRAQDGS